MKKLVLSLTLLVMSVSAFSATPIKMVAGSAAVFKENATALFEIDAEETTWEKTQSLKRYFAEDFDKCMGDAVEAFVLTFNKSSNGLRINNNAQDAKYVIVLKPDNYHCTVGSFYRKFVLMWSTMQVIDLASNELLCELEVKRCALGKPDYTERTAFVNAHSGYAEYLQELVKKNKLKSDGAKTGIIVNRGTKTNINQASGSNTTKTVESKPVDKDEREAEVVLKSGTVIKGKMQ